MKIKIDYEKCSCWWCFRNRDGYIQMSAEGIDMVEKMPFCKKHGKIAKEIIKEKYPDGYYKIK